MSQNGNIIDERTSAASIVFRSVRRSSPVPRIDIANATGLSRASVTSITADLIAKGLIQEIVEPDQPPGLKRGRPRVNLQVRGDSHIVAGMSFTSKSAAMIFMDFSGKRIADYTFPSNHSALGTIDAVQFLKRSLVEGLAQSNMKLTDLSGVGVSIPGFVDAPSGHVYWSPTLTERDVPFQQLLSNAMQMPVFLENDANLIALAEQHFGQGRKVRNFIVISVEEGVGMGVVINGKLHRGANGCGSELGHVKVQQGGAQCRCGQRGCLEAYVGDFALLREARTAMKIIDDTEPENQMDVLLNEARSGNTIATSIFQRSGQMFAMGLANVVSLFSPELIILCGQRMYYDFLYKDGLVDEMKKSIFQVGVPLPDVQVHKWDGNMWAIGAAARAIDSVGEIALKTGAKNVA